ncbi:hypothetical protein U9M48_001175 [Paspalum notatum var. saurae]|uniref:Uncharacterized protein n=1 Tax=Paspalum notatum var. saurae TaxID=547442 RepID=A0AAQ3PN51_PASNO
MDTCPKCGESRWKTSAAGERDEESGDGSAKKRAPCKILRYFPLTPRLEMLYMRESTSGQMRWHREGLIGDGKMRHLLTLWHGSIICDVISSTKGKFACPYRHKDTEYLWLKFGCKHCYLGHRRWLTPNHKWRRNKISFNNKVETREAPIPLTGAHATTR